MPMCATARFIFARKNFGNVVVALPPDRGRAAERRADYHDPVLPPRHALVAFGLWLQHGAKVDALVHMGAHGTLEWLPGKAVALTSECFPEIVTGALPVIYPFIVSNPGEAAQAKRRIAALTIGHLPPPLVDGGPSGEAHELELLLDEYAQADGLDRRRRERLAALIVETAQRTGLAQEAGIAAGAAVAADEALRRIDAWLCDLKDLAIKDGQHIYGRAPAGTDDPAWRCQRRGRTRGAASPRSMAPRRAGTGRRAGAGPARRAADRAQLVHRRSAHAADTDRDGAWPPRRRRSRARHRADAWRHAARSRDRSLGQRDTAHRRRGDRARPGAVGLPADLGSASGRVTGIEVLPCAAMGRPRVDVTWRISGLFRDLFPAQIALLDAAVQAVAARDEDGGGKSARSGAAQRQWRCAAARPHFRHRARRLWRRRRASARPATSTPTPSARPISPPLRMPMAAPTARPMRRPALSRSASPAPMRWSMSATIPAATCLEGAEDAAFVGGFAAAAKLLGRSADLVMLDMTDPQRPRARTLSAALGAHRAGARGQSAFHRRTDAPRPARRRRTGRNRRSACSLSRETTGAVASALFDLLHDAYVADRAVRDFLLRENPQAAAAIAERFEDARRCGVWHPRRNDVDAGLAALQAEAVA